MDKSVDDSDLPKSPRRKISDFDEGVSKKVKSDTCTQETSEKPSTTTVVVSPFKWDDKDSDIAFWVGDFRYYAHSDVLSKGSPVFERMFKGEWEEKSDLMNIRLNERLICHGVFKDFIKFFYAGNADDSLNLVNLPGMLSLADKYDVKDLDKACKDYLKGTPSLKSPLLVPLLTFLYENDFTELYGKMKVFALDNFEGVFAAVSFVMPDVLIDILPSSEIVIKSEEQLFGYVEKWIKNLKFHMNFMNGTVLPYEEIVGKILNHVRFYYVRSSAVLKSFLCDGKCGSILLEKLSEVAKVRAGMKCPENDAVYVRRKYTGKRFDTFNHEIDVTKWEPEWTFLSPETFLQNLSWRIRAWRSDVDDEVKQLSFYLVCFCYSEQPWTSNVEVELRLLNQKDGCDHFIKRFTFEYSRENSSFGFDDFIRWKDLLDESKGYTNNNIIILEIGISAEPRMIAFNKEN